MGSPYAISFCILAFLALIWLGVVIARGRRQDRITKATANWWTAYFILSTSLGIFRGTSWGLFIAMVAFGLILASMIHIDHTMPIRPASKPRPGYRRRG